MGIHAKQMISCLLYTSIKYLREGEDSHLLKQLRRGDFSPELFLDLHGLTREQAKMELAALLLACEDEHVYCASIMTGYGTFTLKKQIPRWLVPVSYTHLKTQDYWFACAG